MEIVCIFVGISFNFIYAEHANLLIGKLFRNDALKKIENVIPRQNNILYLKELNPLSQNLCSQT